jgi:hypothetical protein
MTKISLLLLLTGAALAGCAGVEGTAPDPEYQAPTLIQGPAGGERSQVTHPLTPESATTGNETDSAFPSTVPPTNAPTTP